MPFDMTLCWTIDGIVLHGGQNLAQRTLQPQTKQLLAICCVLVNQPMSIAPKHEHETFGAEESRTYESR